MGDISSDDNLNVVQAHTSKKGFCSVHYGLAFILHFCNICIYTQQMNMSIVMPAMVNNATLSIQLNTSTEAPLTDSQDNRTETLQEYNAVVMAITSQFSIWVRWAPPLERNKLITISLSGMVMGCFIILLTGGLLSQTTGWPYVFYIFGGMGCIYSFLWFFLVYENPMNHPFISTDEKEYIMSSLTQEGHSPGWSIPIKAMIKSLPLWAILLSTFTTYWRFYIVTTYSPTYMNSVLQDNFRDTGILSAVPFLISFVSYLIGGQLVDYLFSRKILRLITIRKVFSVFGVLFPSGLLFSLHWVKFSHNITIAFLMLSSAFGSFGEIGVQINCMDIAPRYAAFLRGVSQVFSYTAGAISPTVAGYFISLDSEFGWRNTFMLSAAIDIVGLIFFLIFSQAEIQDWAKEQMDTHL
ncbi:probable small intestine urate exporter isoform X3 [Erinaceus europaeus]|uniref:Probable small intestine urate exporter isoform X3 n=1 Tax=Erinaceus europaeus TaxID=9365 RepID=A0ABM3X8W0_ERIEU|nr:probable small intestine urate exporter isoform X3 [Erinaceus europaeus]